jgi:hypothetical protein
VRVAICSQVSKGTDWEESIKSVKGMAKYAANLKLHKEAPDTFDHIETAYTASVTDVTDVEIALSAVKAPDRMSKAKTIIKRKDGAKTEKAVVPCYLCGKTNHATHDCYSMKRAKRFLEENPRTATRSGS